MNLGAKFISFCLQLKLHIYLLFLPVTSVPTPTSWSKYVKNIMFWENKIRILSSYLLRHGESYFQDSSHPGVRV